MSGDEKSKDSDDLIFNEKWQEIIIIIVAAFFVLLCMALSCHKWRSFRRRKGQRRRARAAPPKPKRSTVRSAQGSVNAPAAYEEVTLTSSSQASRTGANTTNGTSPASNQPPTDQDGYQAPIDCLREAGRAQATANTQADAGSSSVAAAIARDGTAQSSKKKRPLYTEVVKGKENLEDGAAKSGFFIGEGAGEGSTGQADSELPAPGADDVTTPVDGLAEPGRSDDVTASTGGTAQLEYVNVEFPNKSDKAQLQQAKTSRVDGRRIEYTEFKRVADERDLNRGKEEEEVEMPPPSLPNPLLEDDLLTEMAASLATTGQGHQRKTSYVNAEFIPLSSIHELSSPNSNAQSIFPDLPGVETGAFQVDLLDDELQV